MVFPHPLGPRMPVIPWGILALICRTPSISPYHLETLWRRMVVLFKVWDFFFMVFRVLGLKKILTLG